MKSSYVLAPLSVRVSVLDRIQALGPTSSCKHRLPSCSLQSKNSHRGNLTIFILLRKSKKQNQQAKIVKSCTQHSLESGHRPPDTRYCNSLVANSKSGSHWSVPVECFALVIPRWSQTSHLMPTCLFCQTCWTPSWSGWRTSRERTLSHYLWAEQGATLMASLPLSTASLLPFQARCPRSSERMPSIFSQPSLSIFTACGGLGHKCLQERCRW